MTKRDRNVDRFVEQLQQCHDKMRALAVRVLHNPDTADDALQVAYAKAFVARESFRNDASFSTWLYRIVYRCCIDEQRKLKPVRPLPAEIASPAGAFEDRVSEQLRLHVALEQLTPEQRASVWLVDAEGYSYTETASILEVPEGTVASRVVRARAALRRALNGEEPGNKQTGNGEKEAK